MKLFFLVAIMSKEVSVAVFSYLSGWLLVSKDRGKAYVMGGHNLLKQ